mgnify:CR=1 FL=1
MVGRPPLVALLTLFTLWGCTPQPTRNPAPVTQSCNAITAACVLPFPSSVFTTTDSSTATGLRLQLSEEAYFGHAELAMESRIHDGFSSISPISTLVDGSVSETSVPINYGSTLQLASPILLVNVDANSDLYGTLHPFQADVVASDAGPETLLTLSPLMALEPSSRYAVIVTDKVTSATGSPLTPTDEMMALLSRQRPDDPALESLWEYYQDLLWAVENPLKLSRDQVVQLWDFHTRSQEGVVTDVRDIARLAKEWAEDNPPTALQVTRDEGDSENDSWRRYSFLVDLPYWRSDRFSMIDRGAGGMPYVHEVQRIEGILLLPSNVGPGDTATPILFGHGLGTNMLQMITTLRNIDGHRGPYAWIWMDWDLHGYRGDGLDDILELTGNLNMEGFAATLVQSVSDQIILTALAQNFGSVPKLGDVIQPEPVFYLGQSMGSLVGGITAAVNDDIRANVLNVPGAGIVNILLHGEVIDSIGMRSRLDQHIEEAPPPDFPADLGYYVLMTLAQVGADSGDPMNFARHVRREPFDAMSPPPILLQESIGDGIIPNMTSEGLARTIGLPMVRPGSPGISGVDWVESPTCGDPDSGITQIIYSDIAFTAHLALESMPFKEQLLNYFGSFVTDDHPGNISFAMPGESAGCD